MNTSVSERPDVDQKNVVTAAGVADVQERDIASTSGVGVRASRKKPKLPWVLGSPLIIAIWVLVLFPLAFELYLSFTNWQPSMGDWWHATWINLANYVDLLSSSRFWAALARTLAIVGIGVVIEGGLGLALAMCVAKPFHGRRLVISFILVPMMVLPLVNGFIFFLLFQSQGPVNAILSTVTGRQVEIEWLTNPSTAFFAVIIADVYQWTPLMFLILLAGILAVPENQMDAARVLGASGWQRFKYVILPTIRPVIVIAVIIRAIEIFKIFDPIWIMTQGGPGTESLSTYLYDIAFRNFALGFAAAAALVVLVVVTLLAMRATKIIYAKEEGGVKA